MRGNLSKRGLNGSKGEKGDKGDMPSIVFRINPETGELEYRYDGMLVDREYISSHDIVTKDQVNELKQFVITFDDKFVGDKTYDEIVEAFKEGREIVGLLPPRVPGAYEMLRFTVSGYTDNTVTLSTFMPYEQLLITCNKDNIWSAGLRQMVTEDVLDNRVSQKLEGTEKTINKVKHIDKSKATDDKYPSEKAVVQHVATETSTVKGEMQGLVNEYKQECDEKINKQNETITGVQNRLDYQSIEMMKTTMQLNSNKNNITALQGRVKECESSVTEHDERLKNLQNIETDFAELSEDYSEFRDSMNMSMLGVLDSVNRMEPKITEIENKYGPGIEKLEAIGDVNDLTTEAKANLVEAINELYALCTSTRSFVTIRGGAANWIMEEVKDSQGNLVGTRYGQVVEVENAVITSHSKVDLQVTSDQMVVFYEKDIAFTTENDNGTITVYCVGNIPENDYRLQAIVTEVV